MPRYSSRAFSSVVPSSARAAALGLEIAVDRVPDVLELLLGQGRRKREFMHLVELIKKLAFDPLAAEPGVLLLQSSFDGLLELVERFQTELLGKGVVDGNRARRLDCLRRHLELGVFAGKVLVRVIAGKGDLHLPRFARGHADQLILETWNEGPGPDIDTDIAAGAALERHAVERAGEVDDDPIALSTLPPPLWPQTAGFARRSCRALR